MAPRPDPDELQQRRAEILDQAMRLHGRQYWWEARRFTYSDQDADDALADACVSFMRFFKPRDDDHCSTWMRITVKHAALRITTRNAERRKHAISPEFPGTVEDLVFDSRLSTEERIEGREWLDARAALLTELLPEERTALSLLAYGFSYREIGERQGWSRRQVTRRITEGRARLRGLLPQEGDKS